MKVLVTGGAGYIGSFMTRTLLDKGHEVTVFDNLKRGHQEAIDSRAEFVKGDITNVASVENLFGKYKLDAVMHFAGLISVEESTKNPGLYEDNNVTGSANLFNTSLKAGIKRIIFSSTAAVYGNPLQIPIPEDHAKNPTSEYGASKLKVEKILEDLGRTNQELGFVCLRYFNAAGAALDGSLGENHSPETHIIPLAIRAAISSSDFYLFGTDYDTKDGTCVRDYIHVLDLVEAHVLALEKIIQKPGGYYYNVGTGSGYSNKEVIAAVENVSGAKVRVVEKDRRPGDADKLIADATKIKNELSFTPRFSDLETIVRTAWFWHTRSS